MADTGDAVETRLERPNSLATETRTASTRALDPGQQALSAALTLTVDPVRVMHDEEGRRSYRFALLALGLCTVGLVLLPLFSVGNVAARRGMMACMAVSTVYVLIVSVIRSDGRVYKLVRISVGWAIHTVTLCATLLYFGVFAPTPLIAVLAVHMAAQSSTLWLAAGVYAAVALWQASIAVLSAFGVITDPGLMTGAQLSVPVQLFFQFVVQLFLFAAFVQGRMSRRSFHETLTEMENAVRELAQRDALLDEARRELARALKVGDPGRYTGQQLGHYRLGVLIGRGAMGEVYEAYHVDTDAVAAVKLLSARVGESPAHARRFLRELQVATALDSPHVVQVLELAGESDPIPYLVMERLRGEDLAQVLRIHRRLRPAQVTELVRQVGDGITTAHAHGIVHRDLKPNNIFRAQTDAGPVWKVLDFGVSKLAEETSSLTTGGVVGTPAYMAPEQARGRPVDGRTDLYALGVVAYRSLTGHLPFTGDEIPTVLYDIVHSMPVRPTALAVLPAAFDAVLAIAMAKSPEMRFQSAREMADAFAAAATGEPLPPKLAARAEELMEIAPWRAPSRRMPVPTELA